MVPIYLFTYSGRQGASFEELTITIGQRASVPQCLCPIENAWWNLGKNWGQIGEGIFGFWPPTNSILVFRLRTTVHQILFKIATAGAITGRHTDRQTDRQTPAILLSVPCYAIAMGQIILQWWCCWQLQCDHEALQSRVQTGHELPPPIHVAAGHLRRLLPWQLFLPKIPVVASVSGR